MILWSLTPWLYYRPSITLLIDPSAMTPASTAISWSPASPNCIPIMERRLHIVWNVPILNMTFSKVFWSSQTITAAFACKAWLNTQMTLSRVASFLCLLQYLAHCWHLSGWGMDGSQIPHFVDLHVHVIGQYIEVCPWTHLLVCGMNLLYQTPCKVFVFGYCGLRLCIHRMKWGYGRWAFSFITIIVR